MGTRWKRVPMTSTSPAASRESMSWHMIDVSMDDASMDPTTMASVMPAVASDADDCDDDEGRRRRLELERRLRPIAIEDPPPDRDDDDDYDVEVEEVRVLRRSAGGGGGGDHVVPMLVPKKKKNKNKEKEKEKKKKMQQEKKHGRKKMDPTPSSSPSYSSGDRDGDGGGGDFYPSGPPPPTWTPAAKTAAPTATAAAAAAGTPPPPPTTTTARARGRHAVRGRADPPPTGEGHGGDEDDLNNRSFDGDFNDGSFNLLSDDSANATSSRESRLEEWFRRRGSVSSTAATFDVGSVVGRSSHQNRGGARRRRDSPTAAAPIPAPKMSRAKSEKVRRKARALLPLEGNDDGYGTATPPEVRRKAMALLRRADEPFSRSVGARSSRYAPPSPGWEDRNSGIVAKDLDDLLCAADSMEDSIVATEDLDDLLHTANNSLFGSQAKLFDDDDDNGGSSHIGSSIDSSLRGSDYDVDIDQIDDSLRSGDHSSPVRTAKHINRRGSAPTPVAAGGSTRSSSSRQRANNRISRSKLAKSTSAIPDEIASSRSTRRSSRKKAVSSAAAASGAVLTKNSSAKKTLRRDGNNGGSGWASLNKKKVDRGGAMRRSSSRPSVSDRKIMVSPAHSSSMRKESKKGRTAHDGGEMKKRWNDENSLSVSFRSGASGVSSHSNANSYYGETERRNDENSPSVSFRSGASGRSGHSNANSRKGKKKPKKKESDAAGGGPSSEEVRKTGGGESWGHGGASSLDTPVKKNLEVRDGKKLSKKAIIASRAEVGSGSSIPSTRPTKADRSDRSLTSRSIGVSPDNFMAPSRRREGGNDDDDGDDERQRGNLVTTTSGGKTTVGTGTSPSGAEGRRSGDGGTSSSENNNEHRSKSRFGAILPRKKKQDRGEIDDDGAVSGTGGGGKCPSRTNRLRRYLLSYALRKRRQNDNKDQEEKQNNKCREEEEAEKNERKNPYALTDDDNKDEVTNDRIVGSPIRVSPIAKHAGRVQFSPAHSSAHDIPVPPSLVMTLSTAPERLTDLASVTNLSNSSGGGQSLPDRLSSPERAPSDLTSSLVTNSSSHHLLKISEHDVLSDRDIIKGHSTHSVHSDSALGARGRKGDGWNKGGDGMRLSAHSAVTNTTGMLTLTNHSNSRSPSSGRPVVLNLEDKSRLLSLPLTLHPEESSSEIDTSGSDEREAAKHSILRTLETGTSDVPNEGLTMDALAMNDNTTHVINLPWSDDTGDDAGNDPQDQSQNTKLRGKYTGPVNDSSLRPHGEGALVIQAGYQCLTFYGRWDNGTLVSPLNAEPPGKESCNISTVSVEERRGSPHNSPNVQKQTRSRLARALGNSPSTGAGTTTDKSLNIKYIINRSSKAQHLAHTNRGRNFGHQFRSLRYTLGEACRTPIDMIIHRSNKRAIQSAAVLKKWDQVFIKRSNGLWTVAIMIDRALQPKSKPKRRRHEDQNRWRTVWEIDAKATELEESMLFAIDDDGATKIIDKQSWGKYIRRIKG